ncbi:nuclear distribution protein nudE-like 1-B [Oppia nitens]|uniref:nuclear distribution protein nudE-like 1-B n=1 Tax=Oppia nitens TaxID=1686743 RepID=UPI0023DB28C3|nr:nuclear distribution protein nudE-like 1-B [Oppia nitens]
MDNNCNNNEDIHFESPEEEMIYLRRRVDEYQSELEEFQESSRELEAELEAQLIQSEKRIQELTQQNTRLESENDLLKAKLSKLSVESQNQILELQKDLAEISSQNERLTSYIRELEQSNDDLERAKRALDASLQDFDVRLNQQIERNVLLENEIGEKEELQEVIQRLKDEARDLRQELMIQQKVDHNNDKRVNKLPNDNTLNNINNSNNINNNINTINNNNNNKIRSNSVNVSNSETQTNGTPTKQTRLNYMSRSASNPGTPSVASQCQSSQMPLLSPSTRISALNIVSDLLRKVGALESKLASCRNIVTTNTALTRNLSFNNNRSTSSTPISSPVKETIRDINANS